MKKIYLFSSICLGLFTACNTRQPSIVEQRLNAYISSLDSGTVYTVIPECNSVLHYQRWYDELELDSLFLFNASDSTLKAGVIVSYDSFSKIAANTSEKEIYLIGIGGSGGYGFVSVFDMDSWEEKRWVEFDQTRYDDDGELGIYYIDSCFVVKRVSYASQTGDTASYFWTDKLDIWGNLVFRGDTIIERITD